MLPSPCPPRVLSSLIPSQLFILNPIRNSSIAEGASAGASCWSRAGRLCCIAPSLRSCSLRWVGALPAASAPVRGSSLPQSHIPGNAVSNSGGTQGHTAAPTHGRGCVLLTLPSCTLSAPKGNTCKAKQGCFPQAPKKDPTPPRPPSPHSLTGLPCSSSSSVCPTRGINAHAARGRGRVINSQLHFRQRREGGKKKLIYKQYYDNLLPAGGRGVGSSLHCQSQQRKFREGEGAQLSSQSSNESEQGEGNGPTPHRLALGLPGALPLPRAAGLI